MALRRFNVTELILTQRLRLERPILLLVLLSSLGFALAAGDAFTWSLLLCGLLANAIAIKFHHELSLPRWLVNAAVVLATALFLYDFLINPDFFAALGRYFVLILLCKLFEQKRNRDYAQLIALSAVLIIDAAIATAGLWFALLLLLYVPLTCYVVMVLALKVSLDRHASARLSVEQRPADPHQLAWSMLGQFPKGVLWRHALWAALAAAGVAAAVFLLMPRIQPGLLGHLPGRRTSERGSGGGGTSTGFPQSIRLNDLGRITLNRRVLMEVRLSDLAGADLGRSGYVGYLCGRVYDKYDKGEWSSLDREGLQLVRPMTKADNTVMQQVTMDPSLLPEVFSIAPTVGLEEAGEGSLAPAMAALAGERPDPDVPVRYVAYSWRQPLTPEQVNQMSSFVRRSPTVVRFDYPKASRPSGQELSGIPPRVAQLARDWCADLLAQRNKGQGDAGQLDLQIANRLSNCLKARYDYTLDLSRLDPDIDPVEDFLFNTRAGHCEFFASAMVLMARSLGLKARLIGGFLADNYNATAGVYFVRAADAHAWCEVYLPGQDWVVFDPTAASSRPAEGGLARASEMWNAVRFFWSTRVIGYGESQRQGLFGRWLEQFRLATQQAGRMIALAARNIYAMVVHGRFDWVVLLAALPGVLLGSAILGVAMVLLYGLRQYRRALARRVRPRAAPVFYRRLLRLLERRGLCQRPEQTAREFLLESAGRLGLPEQELWAMAELLYRLRWGGGALAPAEAALAGQTVRRLGQMLKNFKAGSGNRG